MKNIGKLFIVGILTSALLTTTVFARTSSKSIRSSTTRSYSTTTSKPKTSTTLTKPSTSSTSTSSSTSTKTNSTTSSTSTPTTSTSLSKPSTTNTTTSTPTTSKSATQDTTNSRTSTPVSNKYNSSTSPINSTNTYPHLYKDESYSNVNNFLRNIWLYSLFTRNTHSQPTNNVVQAGTGYNGSQSLPMGLKLLSYIINIGMILLGVGATAFLVRKIKRTGAVNGKN